MSVNIRTGFFSYLNSECSERSFRSEKSATQLFLNEDVNERRLAR
jgi:hypothetical protein